MIVPTYWAEARRQRREAKRQVTVRRFGWSDASQADAQAMADRRADEALVLAWVDKKVLRREHKVPYNGADGMPIREEIVARQGDVIVTRNSYGARCLNTPDVCFVDVDFESTFRAWPFGWAALAAAALAGWGHGTRFEYIATPLFFVTLAAWLILLMLRALAKRPARLRAEAFARINAFMSAHPAWGVRIYATPRGLRLLFTHDVFDATSTTVREVFDAVRADQAYVWMCVHQRCFRARLSAKPWRIGITEHLRPRPGVWPVAPERRPERERWLAMYDAKAASFAACRFVEAIGSGVVHAKVAPVLDLHDTACGALTQRPLA